MDIYWGLESDKPKNNKRYQRDFDEPVCVTKKIKLFKEINKMIYSIKNEVHFTDAVTNESIEAVIKIVTKLINKNVSKYEGVDGTEPTNEKCNITFVLDTPGGSVNAILKLVDFIRMTKLKYCWLEYTSIITAQVASAGSIFAIVCDHRYMTKYAMCMIHELSSGRSGKYIHLKSYTEHLTDLHNVLVDIYVERSGKSREEIELLLTKESWYTAEKYLEAGFIDKIV